MDSLEKDFAAGFFEGAAPPCLSLYQPTHRRHPENQQDPIRFRNLVKALRDSLLQKYPPQEAQPLLEPFLALADDRAFWSRTLDGLAVLAARGVFRVYRLPRPVAELAVVAESFHTKPLIRVLQAAVRYQVLGLSRQEIKLFEGDRDALDEVALAEGVPRTLTEALGEELTEPHRTIASYGGVGGSHAPMQHGHGGRETEIEVDEERFFRAVDRAILEKHSRPAGLPLILATLPEHRAIFHRVSHNPFLMEAGIDVHPDALSRDELRERAWRVVEPQHRARVDARIEAFGGAQARDLGHGDLAQVAKAVVAGRVATLLIEADRCVPGRVDPATGAIRFAALAHPEVDDLLDDLAELALKRGGEVVIVPAERMPTQTGIAAIFRY